MVGALLDEVLSAAACEIRGIIVENKFSLAEKQGITAFLLLIPAALSAQALIDSMEQARHLLEGG